MLDAQVERRAENYLIEFIEENDIDVSPDEFEVTVSGRLTRAHGNIHLTKDPKIIKLSRHACENNSWDDIKGTLRHELAHLIAYREFGETGENGFNFRRLLREFDAPHRADGPAREAKYLLKCQECGSEVPRQRKSKTVKYPHRYSCGKCGGNLKRVK